jgi:hypothetical protein
MPEVHIAVEQNPVRASVRFPLHLALLLETEKGSIEATTIDISANGLLFEADRLPPVGTRIVFTMTMPSAVMGSAGDVSVHCTGRIVRHQLTEGMLQAAAVIDEYFLKV